MIKSMNLATNNLSMQLAHIAYVYYGREHPYSQCSANTESVNYVNNFNRGCNNNNPYSNTYNPGWRLHPNFSWTSLNQPPAGPSAMPSNTNRSSTPPGFNQQARQLGANLAPQSSMEGLLKEYMAKNDTIIQSQQAPLCNLEN